MDRHTLDRSVRTAQMAETAPPRAPSIPRGDTVRDGTDLPQAQLPRPPGGMERQGDVDRGADVPDDKSKMTLPYIYMKTAQDDLVPWLASQTDFSRMTGRSLMIVA